MKYGCFTIDDFDVGGKVVLLRVDINSPIDPKTGTILDDTRIRKCAPTIEELCEMGAKVVVLAHQSRPGKDDFTSLEMHARLLDKYVEANVTFVDDVLGPSAREAIKELGRGEVLVLDNVRLYSEEQINAPPKVHAKSFLVRKLSPLCDYFVNDAFGAAHRSHASIVGFTSVLPSAMGRLMEKEMEALSKIERGERPRTFVVGGAKIDTKLRLVEHLLLSGKADRVLVGGLVGLLLLKAKGVKLGEKTEKTLRKFAQYEAQAKRIVEIGKDRLYLPSDIAYDDEGKRAEALIEELPVDGPILDIGINTMALFSKFIEGSATVVANGPMGVFERWEFSTGTNEILMAMARCDGYTVIGGGELGTAASFLGLEGEVDHISTGGGAMLAYLSGDKLPAIEALRESAKLFG